MKLHIHSGNKYPYKLIALWFCELVRKSRMDKASLTWVATVKSQRVKLVSITKSWSCESHEAKTRGEAAAAVRAYQQWWKSIQYGNVLFKCQTFFAAIWHHKTYPAVNISEWSGDVRGLTNQMENAPENAMIAWSLPPVLLGSKVASNKAGPISSRTHWAPCGDHPRPSDLENKMSTIFN